MQFFTLGVSDIKDDIVQSIINDNTRLQNEVRYLSEELSKVRTRNMELLKQNLKYKHEKRKNG